MGRGIKQIKIIGTVAELVDANGYEANNQSYSLKRSAVIERHYPCGVVASQCARSSGKHAGSNPARSKFIKRSARQEGVNRMEREYTKGPWIKDFGGTSGHIKSTAPGLEWTPTIVKYKSSLFTSRADINYHADTITREEQEANAKLIAAAPELLECLEKLTEWGENWTGRDNGLLVEARNVIEKALFG